MTIKIGNAPVSWGIYEFKDLAPKYPYSTVLDQIAETGYTGLELGPWGYLPTDPDLLRNELNRRDLQLLSSFVPINFLDEARGRRAKPMPCRSGGCWHSLARFVSCWRMITAACPN